jgi:hypothetical protein
VPHTRVARFTAMVIAMAGRGHDRGPQGALTASPVAISDIALGVANCVIGWCLLIAARGCLPTCLCRAMHDCLIVGGMLGGDARWLP